jgi:predicted Zn-dependent peptidase
MRFLLSFTTVLFLAGASFAAGIGDLEKRVVEHTCPNGIKLLILERHFSPTVSIRMMFRTGSVEEVSGKTGLAHMFEHMMFKGTKTLGTKNYEKEAPLLRQIDDLHRAIDAERALGDKANQAKIAELTERLREVEAKEAELVSENELWNLYEREGATGLNAGTARDFTQYVVDLPSNKIELWAILDSDRLKNPVFRQFYQEREVVKEERRMRVETRSEGKLYENFLATAYLAHPYHHPTIGWEGDLTHLSVSDMEDFYKRFYTPDALTIAIVGDVKAPEIIAMVDKYFGTWKVSAPPRPAKTTEPKQIGTRRISIEFPAEPHVLMGFHIPTYPHRDHFVAYALSELLGSGTTSRLYKSLVQKKKIATAVEASSDYPGERYSTLLLVSAAPRFPHTAQESEKAILAEIERLKREPIQEWELEKVRNALDVGLLNTLQTNSGMANTLSFNQAIFGDWKYLLEFQRKLKEIKPDDLKRAAQTYLVPQNMTVGTLVAVKK